MNEPVVAFDLSRMLLGDAPILFLLEIVARTIIIYAYTLFLIRWIGSRSIGQLSLVEFLLVIALGSAVGDAMFYPEVPLLHCMAVITVVVLLDKGLSYAVARKPGLEDAIEGKSVRVVTDGIVSWREMRKLNLGHDELFEQLRMNGVSQLGKVRAAYLETNGIISVFKVEQGRERVGLTIEPPWDVSEPVKYKSGHMAKAAQKFACTRCATVVDLAEGEALSRCPNCECSIWHLET